MINERKKKNEENEDGVKKIRMGKKKLEGAEAMMIIISMVTLNMKDHQKIRREKM